MKSTLLALALSFSTPAVFAHEGHSHGSVAEAPHGGIIKEGTLFNFEIVTQGSEVSLYPLAKDGKAVALTDITLTATTQAPKKAKNKVEFKPTVDRFQGTVKESGYRYELQIDATYKGKKDAFKFQVEPQG